MIDFRFFIISIVAVFLALGLGIVLGSGFFGDPIIKTIRREVDEALGRNAELQDEIFDLEARLDDDQDFMASVEPLLLDGMLPGMEVVMLDFDGTDGGLGDDVRAAIEQSGGDVVTEITVNDNLELGEASDAQELARVLDSSSSEPEELRRLFGDELGDKLSTLATLPPRPGGEGDTATARAEDVIDQLAEAGFLSIDASQSPPVPQGAAFVIAAGSPEAPAWPVDDFVESLASSLSVPRIPAVAAETSDSAWGVVPTLREGDVPDAALSTVDHADTIPGRIAVALALDYAPVTIGHWGTDDGASAVVPTPSE